MSQSQLADITKEDYIELSSSHPAWYRVFQHHPGSAEWFLRVILDFDTHDTELTFGPMDADKVDYLAQCIAPAYCHYQENWEGPIFESIIAQGLLLKEEEEA